MSWYEVLRGQDDAMTHVTPGFHEGEALGSEERRRRKAVKGELEMGAIIATSVAAGM